VRLALEDESPQSWFRHAQSVETPAMSSVMQTCQNDLGLNLCVVPPTSCVIKIAEGGLNFYLPLLFLFYFLFHF